MAGNSGYRTKQREFIEQYLQNSGSKHVTAEDILTFLKEQDTPVSKATVYRYLDKMLEQGLIRKYTVEEGMGACYQYVTDHAGCKEHFHLKCNKCGKLFHVSCDWMNQMQAHVFEEHGFVIDNSKTVFYGLCRECRERETEA